MALPKQNTPIYTIEIPSSKQKFKFRPFLVKEQKALLLAQQSEDMNVMVDTLKQVIESCSQAKVDVDKLAIFDLEYIFSQIRAKSVGEKVELFFFCDTCEDDAAKVKITIDLTQLQVEEFDGHTSKIELFDDVGVVLKYPSIDVVKKIEMIGRGTSEIDMVFDVIVECIDYIYDTNEVYYAKEQTKEELSSFINELTSEQFTKIESFFETIPKLRKQVDYKCPVCGKAHNKVLEGLDSFF
jgi:ribosomal protein L44E